jgi:hypothetical protein
MNHIVLGVNASGSEASLTYHNATKSSRGHDFECRSGFSFVILKVKAIATLEGAISDPVMTCFLLAATTVR